MGRKAWKRSEHRRPLSSHNRVNRRTKSIEYVVVRPGRAEGVLCLGLASNRVRAVSCGGGRVAKDPGFILKPDQTASIS
jgi:hypothetical protein